jgi:DNA-binding response OmpR family regulator
MTSTRTTTQILLVDDDAGIRRVVTRALHSAGYGVVAVADRAGALRALEGDSFSLAILDVNLPDANGLDLCAEIHSLYGTPVMMLTVVVDEGDIVRALESGADDYVRKPFSTRGLVARVQSVLRRAGADDAPPPTAGPVQLEPERRRARVNGQPLTLTPTEYRLLVMLVRNSGRVLSHNELLQGVWGQEYEGEHHMLHVAVSRVRQKLGRIEEAPTIRTVPGSGYEFVVSEG